MPGDIELYDWEKEMKGHPCFVDNCTSEQRFLNAGDYNTHLTQDHHLYTANARRTYLRGTLIRWLDNFAAAICDRENKAS